MINLINEVQMRYTGAAVSAAALSTMDANLQPGKIRKCDVALIYKYENLLYKLHMTGAQLRKYMEWCARFYNTFSHGDLTISFNPDVPAYNYDMFDGVNYEIDISQEPGNRIRNLTWPDGTSVNDEDEFDLAVCDYRANSQLLVPGEIYEEGDIPALVDMDVHSEIGGVRELIREHIAHSSKGTIRPNSGSNWRLVGYTWDDELRDKALEMLSSGEILIPCSQGRAFNSRSITIDDIAKGDALSVG